MSSDRPAALSFVLLIFLANIAGWGGAKKPQVLVAPPPTPAPVDLELRLENGRTKFHIGEIIPIELILSSAEHKKYSIMIRDCFERMTYQYHVEPPEFVDREVEVFAGLHIDDPTCGGPAAEIDPGAGPSSDHKTLNSRFQMDTPGTYRISVTSSRLGFPVTSNTVELEILPSDATWEREELARGIALLGFQPDKPEHGQGCVIVRYLGTDAAALEMAQRYGNQGDCDGIFELGIIAAKNRKRMLDQLEAGLAEPDRPISITYLRTTAIVSLYRQHPSRYPRESNVDDSSGGNPMNSGLWREQGEVTAEELRYAKILAALMPKKEGEARARSLEALTYLGRTLGHVEIPPEILNAVRDRMPDAFANLSTLDQECVLKQEWPEFSSPEMIPVLKQIVANGAGNQGIVLRRLYELSPDMARPYILHELSNKEARIGADVLSLLPEKELPEFDAVILQRVNETAQDGGVRLVLATALLQRYASSAIAPSVLPLLENGIGKMEGQSEANLLAYFLRVRPVQGAELLRKGVQAPGCNFCGADLLRRLADVRMSAEVEHAALDALDDPEPSVVENALFILQRYGSIESRQALLRHFQKWNATWKGQKTELDDPKNHEMRRVEEAYFRALGTPQGWLSSKEELREYGKLCVSEVCSRESDQIINYSFPGLIGIIPPIGDETDEHFALASPNRFGMDELKQKMSQFPKGSIFTLDARSAANSRVQRAYNELKPWAEEHGFGLKLLREQ